MNEGVRERRKDAEFPSVAAIRREPRPLLAIVVGGLITGILDMTYAILVYSPQNPLRIPQAIATGLLGRESFNLGMGSVVLGVACHFTIALGAATVFYLA